MQCKTMQCNECNAMQCIVLQCNAMQCNAMQCNAMQYNSIYEVASTVLHGKILKFRNLILHLTLYWGQIKFLVPVL